MDIASGELTTLALCWRIVRRDGVGLGFTTHDRDLDIKGLRYRAAPGMLPSAVAQVEGLEVDSLDIAGALTADAITVGDLEAGRWDGARVQVFMADWERPDAPVIPLARGELGAVSTEGSKFEAELRGPTAALDAPACEQTSPECRAELGDRRCRVDMAGRVRRVAIVSCDPDGVVTLDDAVEGAPFRFGRLLWIGGRNSGVSSPIVDASLAHSGEAASTGSGQAWVRLREPPPFAVEGGEAVELTQGCDKRLETCRDRFANVVNFRGEPHLPGNDLLTRYPGA